MRRLAHRLALGSPWVADVDGMLRRMKPRQLLAWAAYDEIEPFGARRDNYHAALVAKMVADAAGVLNGKTRRPYQLEDLLLKFGTTKAKSPEAGQSVAQQIAILNIIGMSMNAAKRT